MGIAYKYSYVKSLLKRYGFRGLILKTKERASSPMLKYSKEYARFLPTEEELELQRIKADDFPFKPLVSIVVPTYETPERFLRVLIDSVVAQTYTNFELVLADGSNSDVVKNVSASYDDDRICYYRLEKNDGISGNTNQGFEKVKGDYIALIDHDDLITENALFEMIKKLNSDYTAENRNMAMIYSDEDKISGEPYTYSRPHFKPDFNQEFVRHNNYFCHFLMFSRELQVKVGGLRKKYDGAQDYDFVLRCIAAGANVCHVPKILYHWRIHEGSTAGNSANKAYAFDAGCAAIENYLDLIGESGKVSTTPNLGVYKVEYTFKCSEMDTRTLYSSNASRMSEEEEKALKNLLSEKDVLAVAPRLLDTKNRVVAVGTTFDKEGNVADLCSGIPSVYKGYFLHGVIPKDVSILRTEAILWRQDAYDRYNMLCEKYFKLGLDAEHASAAAFLELGKTGRFIVDPEISVVVKNPVKRAGGSNKLFAEQIAKLGLDYDKAYNPLLKVEQNKTYEMNW